MPRRRLLLAVLAAVVLTVACTPAPAKPPDNPTSEGWTRAAFPPAVVEPAAVDLRLTAIDGGGYLLVGTGSPAAGRWSAPVAWRSPDGLRWDPVGVEDAGAPGGLGALARRGSVVAAAGWEGTAGSAVPAVWVAVDAATLRRAGRLPVPDGVEGVVAAGLAGGPAGWVAVGASAPGAPAPGPEAPAAVVWFSADGDRWEAGTVEGGDRLADPLVGGAAVAALGDGFVAVARGTDPGSVPLVLRSTDGRRWELATPTGLDAVPSALVTVGDGAVAVVGEGPARRLVATTDGIRWTPLAVPAGTPTSVAADGDRLLVATTDPSGSALLVRRSVTDGGWEPLALPDGLATATDLGPVTVVGEQVVVATIAGPVVTWVGEAEGRAEWRSASDLALPRAVRREAATVTGLAPFGELVVAAGHVSAPPDPAPTGGRLWWSDDEGATWTESILSAAILDVTAVAAADERLVAVGRARQVDGSVRGIVLGSDDGRSWEVVGDLGVDADPRSVAAIAGSFTVVGAGPIEGSVGVVPVAWRAGADQAWIRSSLPLPDDEGRAPGVLSGLCPTGDRLVAVGWIVQADGEHAVVVASGDGETWRDVPTPAAPGPRPGAARFAGCAGSAAGGLLIWAPGELWLVSPTATAPGDWAMTSPGTDLDLHAGVATADGWCVAGDVDAQPGLWCSVTGTAWDPVEGVDDLVVGPGRAELTAALGDDAGLVVGGTYEDAPVVLFGEVPG